MRGQNFSIEVKAGSSMPRLKPVLPGRDRNFDLVAKPRPKFRRPNFGLRTMRGQNFSIEVKARSSRPRLKPVYVTRLRPTLRPRGQAVVNGLEANLLV